MGKLALAAKITHVPSMYLSELRRPAPGHAPGRHRRPHRDRPALPRTGRGHHRGVRHALAGQRQLPRQLRAALQGAVHQQRAAAFHQQPAASSSRAIRRWASCWRRSATNTACETLAHHATTLEPGVRHAGADALHERGPALQGDLGLGPVHGALPQRQRAPGLGHAPRHRGALRRHRGLPGQRLARRTASRRTAWRPNTPSRSGARF